MVDTRELLSSLFAKGVKIWADSDHLRFHAPIGAIQPDEMRQLRLRKREILQAIQESQRVEGVPMYHQAQPTPVPLTATQRLPWHSAALPKSTTTVPITFRIGGPLDVSRLNRAINALRFRHSALRIRIRNIDDLPVQIVDRFVLREVEVIESTKSSPGTCLATARETVARFINTSLDLGETAFEVRVIKLSHDDHVFVALLDHLVCDGFSAEIIKRDIWSNYNNDGEIGLRDSQIEAPMQFVDYASWLDQVYVYWLKERANYWTKRLKGVTPVNWKGKCNAVGDRYLNWSSLAIPLERQLMTDLQVFSKRARVLPAIVMLASLLAALFLLYDQREMTIAFVDSGRFRAELFQMVGCLACILHMRIQSTQDQTIANLLTAVQREFHCSLENRDFDWVTTLIPGFAAEVCFNWLSQVDCGDARARDGLQFESFVVSQELSKCAVAQLPFKLMFACVPEGQGANSQWYYRSDCFDPEDVETIAGTMKQSLAALVCGLKAWT